MTNEKTNRTTTTDEDRWQALVDRAHDTWRGEKHSLASLMATLPEEQRDAMCFAKLNYQVNNGGFMQWHDNGYADDCAPYIDGAFDRAERRLKERGRAEDAKVMSRVGAIVDSAYRAIRMLDDRDDGYDIDDGDEYGFGPLDTAFYEVDFHDVCLRYFEEVEAIAEGEDAERMVKELGQAERNERIAMDAFNSVVKTIRDVGGSKDIIGYAGEVQVDGQCIEKAGNAYLRVKAADLAAVIDALANALHSEGEYREKVERAEQALDTLRHALR